MGRIRKYNTGKLYKSADDFFSLKGNIGMRLSAKAATAIEVCNKLTEFGRYVWRIEGGIMRGEKFEAKIDCIWDSKFPNQYKPNLKEIAYNNALAIEDIMEESLVHNAFIITANYDYKVKV